MNPALVLKRLFAKEQPNITGTVVAVEGQAITVQTVRGIVQAKSVDATAYKVDDEVLLREGIVQGRVKRTADIPTYFV